MQSNKSLLSGILLACALFLCMPMLAYADEAAEVTAGTQTENVSAEANQQTAAASSQEDASQQISDNASDGQSSDATQTTGDQTDADSQAGEGNPDSVSDSSSGSDSGADNAPSSGSTVGEEDSQGSSDGLSSESGTDAASSADSVTDASAAGEVSVVSAKTTQAKAFAKATTKSSAAGKTYVLNTQAGGRYVAEIANGSTKNGGNAHLYISNGTAAQRWNFVDNGDGTVRIVNGKSGLVLDVKSGKVANGTNIQQYAWNETLAQRWYVTWVNEAKGIAMLVSALDSNYCIDVKSGKAANSTNLQLYKVNNTSAQYWLLIDYATGYATKTTLAVTTSSLSSKKAYTLNSVSSSKNVTLNSTSAGAKAALAAVTDYEAQGFYVTKENGYYRLTNVHSKLSLTVDQGDIVPGAAVTQAKTVTGSEAQLFSVAKYNGNYYLISALSGHALAISGSSLVTAYVGSAKAQQWSISEWKPQIAEGAYRIVLDANGSYGLDVASGSFKSGANVRLYKWNKTVAQRWVVTKSGSKYAIRNVGSGLYLRMNGSNVAQSSSSKGASLWTLSYNFGTNWGYRLLSSSGLSMDVKNAKIANKTNVQVCKSNNTKAQAWEFVSVDLLPDGWYQIGVATNTNLRLDVAGGSAKNKANVRVYKSNNTAAQIWHVLSLGNGWYRLVSSASNKSLDVSGGSKASKANVQQYTSNGGSAQKWKITMGKYGLIFQNGSGKVLDVAGGSNKSGANVWQYSSNSSKAQGWLLVASKPKGLGARIEKFTQQLIKFANDDSHGYDQTYRWGEKGDYDCSSLVVTCAKRAGFATGSASYTGNMKSNFTKNGWQWIATTNLSALQPGDILLRAGSHTAAIVSATGEVAAHINEKGTARGGKPGDQTGYEISVEPISRYSTGSVNIWWTGILRPTTSSK